MFFGLELGIVGLGHSFFLHRCLHWFLWKPSYHHLLIIFLIGQWSQRVLSFRFLQAELILWLGSSVFWFIRRRFIYRQLSPGIPHSLLLGHLLVLAKVKASLPKDVHIQVVVSILADLYCMRKHQVFYLDLYPIQTEPFMVLISPHTIQQASISLGKHSPAYSKYCPVIGKDSLIIANSQAWKSLRAEFNPSFSPSHLQRFLPALLDEGSILVKRIQDIALGAGSTESLEELASAALADIIGHVTFGDSFGAQGSRANLVTDLTKLSRIIGGETIDTNSWKDKVFRRQTINKLTAKTSAEIKQKITHRWHHSHCVQGLTKKETNDANIQPSPIVDTVLRHKLESGKALLSDTLDMLTENAKGIIFGGIDTSSSVLSHGLFELSQNPMALKRLRKEHNDVLGSDASRIVDILRQKPSLLNELPFTVAVIKETMRMYSPAGSTRMGEKSFNVTVSDTGMNYPTEGCMVYLGGPALHHDPDLYPWPSEFHPVRFLPEGRDKFPVLPRYAYRPFEMGPRTCLGQDLALLELKVLLVLLVRRFDFEPDYKERDGPHNSIEGYGGRAYQTMYTTAKPKGGIPMRIRLRAPVS